MVCKGNKGNVYNSFVPSFTISITKTKTRLCLSVNNCASSVLFIYSFFYTDSFWSVWCWLANIIAFIMLFAPQIDKNIRL